ncbi:MAG: ABC transporter permease [Actinomycetia bacterium]|nr:ABC transporter permease [Actinomycetes bacterium]
MMARRVLAQTRSELILSFRQGEQVLLVLGIPVLLLVFFSAVDVLPTSTDDPIDFLAPGILSLALMSTAMTSLAIGIGFDRQYKVLKRLGATPLGRAGLVSAKTTTVVVIELVQAVVLIGVALALGWTPSIQPGVLGGAVVLGSVAFAGLGLLIAGRLPGLMVLAAANALYVFLLLIGDMVIPLDEFPSAFATIARLLPPAALTEVITGAFDSSAEVTGQAWGVLAGWALVAPPLATRLFHWE